MYERSCYALKTFGRGTINAEFNIDLKTVESD